MVTLHRTTKRLARGSNSGSATKSTAQSKSNRSIPAMSEPIPAIQTQNSHIPVTVAPNPAHTTVPIQSCVNHALFRKIHRENLLILMEFNIFHIS